MGALEDLEKFGKLFEEIPKIAKQAEEGFNAISKEAEKGFNDTMNGIRKLFDWFKKVGRWTKDVFEVVVVDGGNYVFHDIGEVLWGYVTCVFQWWYNIYLWPCVVPYYFYLKMNIMYSIIHSISNAVGLLEGLFMGMSVLEFIDDLDLGFGYIAFTRIPYKIDDACFNICKNQTGFLPPWRGRNISAPDLSF